MNKHELTIPEDLESARIDAAIASLMPDVSRSRIQKLISNGHVLLNTSVVESKKQTVNTDDVITLSIPQDTPTQNLPQKIELDIIHEDADLMIINKPAGLIVHPGAGAPDQTLLNAILFHHPDNKSLPQAGLIHRLDKDTTGLLLIAKNEKSYFHLNKAMAERHINRVYFALVKGVVIQGGTIDEPLARHPKFRQRFCIHPNGRQAVTHYDVLERYAQHTLLKVKLETGRTHQIRVHMLHINHPIVGDQTYNRSKLIKQNTLSSDSLKRLYDFPRQALHASSLSFVHPSSKEHVSFNVPLPNDYEALLEALRS